MKIFILLDALRSSFTKFTITTSFIVFVFLSQFLLFRLFFFDRTWVNTWRKRSNRILVNNRHREKTKEMLFNYLLFPIFQQKHLSNTFYHDYTTDRQSKYSLFFTQHHLRILHYVNILLFCLNKKNNAKKKKTNKLSPVIG